MGRVPRVAAKGYAPPRPAPKCGADHPTVAYKYCKLDLGHVGVHESTGMRWWGSVVFPRLGETRLR